ncbi:hypothetical protein C8A01DRAFT_31430 [Parachaetomium inaequale]|uniref:DUF4360 domain-containing protein n=1 Tax=Parachaetomium inaequale TaxID=2588326 RepID=A0AAN6SW31_9PEZI|nr:hypothetical protein C8A01DRAFT_31430 [Parachaetomium inaequale]
MGLLSNLTLLLTAASAVAADTAAPATPRITSISYSGNGCTKDPKFSGNFNDPTLTFANFAASLPGANQTVNCQVHLQGLGASPGWQVALKSNVVKGYVVLAPGTALTHYTTVFFSEDAASTDTIRGTIANDGAGTVKEDVTLVAKADGTKAWSPCTGSDGYTGIMNINFRGALTGDGKAYFEADTEEWELEWRRC